MADNMTIDELAGVIKGEFDKVEERLDSLDKKIDLRPTLKQIMA